MPERGRFNPVENLTKDHIAGSQLFMPLEIDPDVIMQAIG